MEKTQIIAKIYGYMICLVAVITFLICITDLVNCLIDHSNPMYADKFSYSSTASTLLSFETYKINMVKDLKATTDTANKTSFLPDDKTLHNMYNEAKENFIQSTKFRLNRSIVVDSLLIGICIILFTSHWFWMIKLNKKTV